MGLAGRLLNRRASQFALFKFVFARPRRAKSRPGCDHTAWWCEVIRGPRSAAVSYTHLTLPTICSV